MLQIPTTKLSNGVEVPVIGLGVYQSDNMTQQAVLWALEAGYRLIDAATLYGNEKEVGEAIRASGLRREEIFVTTKMWDTDQIAHTQRDALQRSLDLLGLDYVDLYLLHWPVPGYFQESWSVVEQCYEEGLTRAIGVSNFFEHHLDTLISSARIMPMVDQFECHPYNTKTSLRSYCAQRNIQCQAWSPLQQGVLLQDPTLLRLAEKYGKSTAQIILRWDVQNGVVPVPKSVHKERISSNADIFDFALTDEEMAAINLLNQDKARLDPDTRKYF